MAPARSWARTAYFPWTVRIETFFEGFLLDQDEMYGLVPILQWRIASVDEKPHIKQQYEYIWALASQVYLTKI